MKSSLLSGGKLTKPQVIIGIASVAFFLELLFFFYVLIAFWHSNHRTLTFISIVVAVGGVFAMQTVYFWNILHSEKYIDYRWHRRVEFYPLATFTFFSFALGSSWVMTLLQSFSDKLWDAISEQTTVGVRVELVLLVIVWFMLLALSWALALFHHHYSTSSVLIVQGDLNDEEDDVTLLFRPNHTLTSALGDVAMAVKSGAAVVRSFGAGVKAAENLEGPAVVAVDVHDEV